MITQDKPEIDDFLAHYGVLGMKWGIRKDAGTKTSQKEKSEPLKPSRRQVRATAKYLRKGYDFKIAEKKAKGRIMAENILMVAGATAVAAVVGYASYKAGERYFGGVNLPMNTKVHHVNIHGPNLDIKDKPMFVSFDKRDQKFYDSIFANFAKNRDSAENVYRSTLKATTNIKAPSNFQAKKLYKEFSKIHGLKDSYSEFNYSFNSEGHGSPKIKDEFINFMKGKGYNAIIDNFDTMKSLRKRTQKPTILFDPTASIKKVEDILLDNDKVELNTLKYELGNLTTKAIVNPQNTTVSLLVGLGVFAKNRQVERNRELQVASYKKQHPDSKLHDSEIYNLILDSEKRK